MEQVKSIDGTTISFKREGSGDPVLLVHGGGPGSGEDWALVAPHLASRYTVVTMDRRGRGASGGGVDYSYNLEAADLVSVLQAIGGTVHVVGHSSGCSVVLRAAPRSQTMRSLVLYEPPLAPQHIPQGLTKRIEELLRSGDEAAAAELFMVTIAATPEEIELIKHLPEWDRSISGMRVAPREANELRAEPVDLDAISRIRVPVLILVGELTTSPLFLEGLERLEQALPDVRRATIPGQRHMAIAFAPEALAERIGSFLDSVDQRRAARSANDPD